MVKLNTHKYAISVIRSDLKEDYIKKACRELKSSIKYWRCIWDGKMCFGLQCYGLGINWVM